VRCTLLSSYINPLKAKLNPICHLLALLGAHHILHVSRVRVKLKQYLINSVVNDSQVLQGLSGPSLVCGENSGWLNYRLYFLTRYRKKEKVHIEIGSAPGMHGGGENL